MNRGNIHDGRPNSTEIEWELLLTTAQEGTARSNRALSSEIWSETEEA